MGAWQQTRQGYKAAATVLLIVFVGTVVVMSFQEKQTDEQTYQEKVFWPEDLAPKYQEAKEAAIEYFRQRSNWDGWRVVGREGDWLIIEYYRSR